MSENIKKYRFGDDVIEAPENLSAEDVREAWKEVHPALENAEILTAEDGTVEFHVRAGSKG
jgi:phage terminase small subunit